MEHTAHHTTPPETKPHNKLPWIIAGSCVALLLAAYLALCAVAVLGEKVFPNTRVADTWDLGGLRRIEAQDLLSRQADHWGDGTTFSLFLSSPSDPESSPFAESDVTLTFGDLGGVVMDGEATARRAYDYCHEGSFFLAGYRYLRSLISGNEIAPVLRADGLPEKAGELAERLSLAPVDTSYEIGDNLITITKARDGFTVNSAALGTALADALKAGTYERVVCPYAARNALVLSAQSIYDEVAGEMKNAGYDPATKAITPEQLGAEFDIAEAQRLLSAAAPGSLVEIPAQIQRPTVTADRLKTVLFRDVLGTYTTHVGGTAARIGNVKLSAAAINGYIMNSGDIFSYNEVVGQRTAANGYLAAPAYVKGETVDEIGGGICQTSSTLYMTTLLSNLEIVTRAAHRYVPAYIPPGMDATVSWGGPEYRFANNTDYPIKITASVSSKNNLTIAIYGTKTDDTYVKMTKEELGSTPFEVKYEDDPTLPAGTEKVKQTPYTGLKVRTYRNVYNGDGKLVSSTFEASSDYKSRDKIILRGPAAAEKPVTPSDKEPKPDTETTPPTTGGTGTTSPDTGDSGFGVVDPAPNGDGTGQ